MAEGGETNSAIVGGHVIILNALRQLVEHGLIIPLQRFHSQIKQNEQERRITKATVESCLAPTAERIAAVVEAKCPASRPTIKGLIQEDVDTLAEKLRRRIQSLKGKLAQEKNVQGNGKRTKKVTKGSAIASTKKNTNPAATTTPKLKLKLKSLKKSKKCPQRNLLQNPLLLPKATIRAPMPKGMHGPHPRENRMGKGEGRALLLANSASNQVEGDGLLWIPPCLPPLHSYEREAGPGRHVPGLLFPQGQQLHLP
jgi:hypothetical protein